ncbi:MAG TPA: diguanylate cyclase [Candidatus Angelobacter sp.]|nr:diguanylate cyclase [Candidatus Angelobacter sp.]
MPRRVTRHVWLLSALALSVGLVLAGLYWQLAAGRHGQAGQERAAQALREMALLMSDMTDADNAGQSILYTGQEQYFDSFHTAVASAKERMAVLTGALRDDAEQAQRLTELSKLVDAQVADLRARIGMRQQSGGTSSIGAAPPPDGKLTAEIRSTVTDLMAAEQALLAGSATIADDSAATARTILLACGPLLLIALALAAAMAVGLIKQPLDRIIVGGKSIAGGDFSHRIPIAGGDEFGTLAELFNNIAVRLRAEQTMNQRASAELRDANEELVVRGGELEARGRIIDVLGKMAHRLQSCDSEEEFADVVRRFASQVLPQVPGVLYLLNNSRNMLRAAAEWNSPSHHRPDFRPPDCWALRRGHAHVVSGVDVEVVCHHVTESPDLSYRCFPMLAQGETLGLLYIEEPPAADAERLAAARAAIADHWRIEIMVENIALALGNHRLREALRIQSIRDPLTGLFNRRYLEETLEIEFARASRAKTPLSIMMIDVDHFKRFNDNFGHDAGDAVLKAVAQALNGGMRRGDITCRYGGEEFTIFAPGAALQDGERRADVLRQTVAAMSLVHNGRPLGSITASFGVAAFPLHGATPAEVLQAADEALYRAKKAGRDRVEIAPPKESATVAIDAARA